MIGKTCQVQGEAPFGDYEAKFGTDYYGTFRIDTVTGRTRDRA
jgi:hypothetical protein